MTDRSTQEEIEWAHRYDGYRRLASAPDTLEAVLRVARDSYLDDGSVPDWCGVDFLRGWAFYLVRGDRHSGGGTLGQEWEDVLEAVRRHPAATAEDIPPPPSLRSTRGRAD